MQADFIIARSVAALERIKGQSRRPEEMAARYYAVASVPNGMYALIDYVNFKGEGTNPAEHYRGIGWGLRQVLEEMRSVSPGQPAAVEFAEAAKRVLQRRVDNSPRAAEKRAGLPDGGTGAIPIRGICDEVLSQQKRPVVQLSLT